jgi:PAS domain S-box-containing protein
MTKEELLQELTALRRCIEELETAESSCRSSEAALRERYRRIVEDLPDLVCRYKPDTTITFVNNAYAQYFGKTTGELIGTSFLDLIPPEDHEYVRKSITSLNENSPFTAMEHKVLAPDGQQRWHLWRDRALFDGSGNITEIQSIGQDITERKRAEEALKESEERYRILFNSGNDAVFVHRISDNGIPGKFIEVNDIACQMYGYTKEEFMDMLPADISDPEKSTDLISIAGELFTDRHVVFETVDMTKDGKSIPVEISSQLFMLKDEPVILSIVRDITARKAAEEKQKETYLRLETLVESIPFPAYFKDARGRHVVVNKACCEFIGLAKEELLGKTCEELLPPELAESCRKSDEEVLKGHKTIHKEEQFDGKDGNKIILETIKTPLYDENGNTRGLVGLSRDITERKRAEEELEYRNLLFSIQQETSLDGILVVDEKGEWVSFNQRFLDMWGIPADIVKSKSDEEALQHVLDKLADPEGFIVRVQYLYENVNETSNDEIELNDGRTFDRYSSPVTSASGEKYFGRVWYFRDITQRRRAEEALKRARDEMEQQVAERTTALTAAVELLRDEISERQRNEKFTRNILESVDEWLIVIDLEYRIISANRAYCDHAGLPLEEVLGRRCYEMLHHRDSPCFETGEDCSARRAFSTGEPATAMHTHFHEGGFVYVETKTYPMRDDAGNVVSAIQIIHDITEKRRLEEQLRHSQKMEAVGQLAGGVAHDFNNRLAAIMNYAFILKTKMSSSNPLLVHVNQILNSSEQAAHLTQNLLTFSRKHIINPRPVRLNDIVGGIERLLVRVIGEDVELKTEIAEEELVVMADSDQVEHVLINLATNARDAMPGTGQVAIGTSRVELGPEFFEGRRRAKPGPYALVTFMDTGEGMNDETRAKVFEPFFTTKGVGKGTGLGLSIAYGIIKQHGGYINVESEPDLGTAFYIFLPLLPSLAEHVEPEKLLSPSGGTETVLLVEDDEDVRKPVRQMLEGFGYAVIEAVDGNDAIEKFLQSRKKVGLLMLDVILPGLSGIEVLKEIRKVAPGIRAIFTSGYSEEHVRRKGLLEDGTTFLLKPVVPEVLLKGYILKTL